MSAAAPHGTAGHGEAAAGNPVTRQLADRRYLVPVDVVLEVSDRLLPGSSGTWRLCGAPAGASCERATARADLAMAAGDLAAAFLAAPRGRCTRPAG